MEISDLELFFDISEGNSYEFLHQKYGYSRARIRKLLSSLESEMGIHLFDPNGTSELLTDAGITLSQQLAGLLPEINLVIRHASHYSSVRTLTYSVVPETPCLCFDALARSFMKLHEGSKVREIHYSDFQQAINAVNDYQLDFVISHEMPRGTGELKSVRLTNDRLMVVIPDSSPLKSFPAVTFDMLKGQTLAVNEIAAAVLKTIEVRKSQRLRVRVLHTFPINTLAQGQENGCLCLMPESELYLLSLSSVAVVPLADGDVPVVLYFKDDPGDRMKAALISLCQDWAEHMPEQFLLREL